MPDYNLTSRRINACKPRKQTYTISDRKVKGLCLAVNPGGRKTFHVRSDWKGRRIFKAFGDAATMGIGEARTIAADMIAAFRRTAEARNNLGPETPLSVVAEITHERHERLWKPRTMVLRNEYLKLILPEFGERAIGGITRRDIEEWHRRLHNTPASANGAAAEMSSIMAEAEALGCRPEDSNPVQGLRRFRMHGRKRVPTEEEIGRLGQALRNEEKEFPRHVAFIRLLILTGCRRSEILELRWKDYRNGNLHLVDSKSGPKTVFLSTPAREVLEGINTRNRKWVFPSLHGSKDGPQTRPVNWWIRLRKDIGLEWLRIHDLRHAYASFAIRSGADLVMVKKLLGHSQIRTTMRYAHLDDATLRAAATKATEGLAVAGRADQ